MRHTLNFFEKTIGGQSQSPAKQAAARINGRNGGRKTKYTTLGEYIMRQSLSRDQVGALAEAWLRLKIRERERLATNYGVKYPVGWSHPNFSEVFASTKATPKRLRGLLRLFRFLVRWEMKN